MRLFCFLFLFLSGFSLSQTSNSIEIKIEAFNLSEDMSVLSTRNDEIIFQIYQYNAYILDEPIFISTSVFDEQNRVQLFKFDANLLNKESDYLVLLIENDYERSDEQRNSVIRIHHKSIFELYNHDEILAMDKYLDTDDLLGMKIISNAEIWNSRSVQFEGVQNLEKYKYEITFNFK